MSNNSQIKRVHLFISGRVQGVSYRYYTHKQALLLGLKGWVRNLKDGRVEALFEGDQESIEKISQWCQQGPDSAKVEQVLIREETPEGLTDFRIIYSGPHD